MREKKRKFKRAIGERLRDLREEWRLDRPGMAKRLGVTANAYGKNENGETTPNPPTLLKLLEEFNISMDWFLFEKGPKFHDEKKGIEDMKKKLVEPLEKETAHLKEELEATTIQKEKAEKELAEIKSKWGNNPVPEISPEQAEMLIEMNRTPLLRYEILAQYHRFLKENK
ncbi:MAG: helix-turn-helix domain-containing protein [bacterium]|nr:helix-turn-helix domain-containing protein [bacterium]